MQLNHDCIRDILLCVEECTDYTHFAHFHFVGDAQTYEYLGAQLHVPEYQAALDTKYTNGTVLYHIRYCSDAGLLNAEPHGRDYFVSDLTAYGHEYLASIRDPERWVKTTSIASQVRSFSLDVIKSIAGGLAEGSVKSFLSANGL